MMTRRWHTQHGRILSCMYRWACNTFNLAGRIVQEVLHHVPNAVWDSDDDVSAATDYYSAATADQREAAHRQQIVAVLDRAQELVKARIDPADEYQRSVERANDRERAFLERWHG